MQTSTLTHTPVWRRSPGCWLVCLDLQRDYVVPGRPRYAAENAQVAAACVRVLGHARDAGWRIVHSQLRRDDRSGWPRELFSAPIEGLRPLITEPVFFRSGLSAFADPGFASEMRAARGDEVFLVGFSLADTCLATVMAGIDEGLSLTLLEDAVGAGATPALASATRTVLKRFVRLASSRRIAARGLEVGVAS
jgi:nicotinamidase-related amidase